MLGRDLIGAIMNHKKKKIFVLITFSWLKSRFEARQFLDNFNDLIISMDEFSLFQKCYYLFFLNPNKGL